MRDKKFWEKQKEKNTKLWQSLNKQWNTEEYTIREIAANFETSDSILRRLRTAGLLSKRNPVIKIKPQTLEDFEPKKKRTKEDILAELLEKKVTDTHGIPGLPKLIRAPVIKKVCDPTKEEAQIVMLSDLHPGVKTKTFNTDVFKRRMENFTKGILKIAALHRQLYPIRELHVFCLGDMVNGEKVGKNVNADEFECSVDEQIFKHMAPAVVQALGSFACEFEQVFVHSVRGNHGSPAGRDSSYSTNWDTISMRHVAALMSEVDNIHFDIEALSTYKIVEVKGYYFLLTHGDSIPIHLTIPFYGMTTRALRMRAIESIKSEVVEEILRQLREEKVDETKAIQMLTSAPFSYFCTGHFHVANRFDFNNLEFLTNGSFKSDDQYALSKMGMGNAPCQVTFGVSAKRGITWHYKVQVDR